MIGETLAHYEILEKLGEGGMGVVYKARDLRLHRFVALKFLPSEITATPERIARFELEARAISALNHPHISTIHAMDEAGDRRFLVLEFLPGGTLRSRMNEFLVNGEAFPIRAAVALAIEMAEGLDHAHRMGVVHRDMKPENVMFTAEGLLRITDFGLARSAASSGLTRSGTTVGTASYMAPEQASLSESSPGSDLFSLGVILYEMAAGRRPFAGASDFSTMHAIVHDAPPTLRQLRPDAPAALERIVLRLLEKDPAKRFQSGASLVEELRGIDGAALSTFYSGPTRTMMTADRVASRSAISVRRRAALAGAVVVLAATGLLSWMKLRPQTAKPPRDEQLAILPFTAKSGKTEDVAFGNGMAGIVAGKLAALGGNLWIIPDNDLRQNRVATPMEANKVFGVALALTGEVERDGAGAASIDMHLIDAASGRVLRSASIKPGKAVTPLEESVVKQAAAMLGLSLDPLAMNRLRADETHTANAYDYYVLGNGYLQRYDQSGNIGSSIAAFQRAIQLDPSYAMAYAGLSAAWVRQYRSTRDAQYLERARDAAAQALSRNESLDSPHIALGVIAMSAGQTDEGIRQLRMALDRDPVNADAARELANAYLQAGKLADAEATYKRSIQLRPNFWLGYLYLGTFYNNRGRYAEAEQQLEAAARLTPDNYVVFRNLGGVQMARGEWADAERNLKQAVGLRPGGSVYSNLGTLYIYTGRYADAVPALEQAVALAGSDDKYSYVMWGNLGDAYHWTEGREASAEAAWRKAADLAQSQLAVNPNDATLIGQIAVYEAKLAQIPQAEQRIRTALRLVRNDPAILFDAALVLEMAGKRSESLKSLASALRSGYSLDVVEREPELASLRKDPRYMENTAHPKEQK